MINSLVLWYFGALELWYLTTAVAVFRHQEQEDLQEALQKILNETREKVRMHEETVRCFQEYKPLRVSYHEAHERIERSKNEDEQEA